MKIKKIKEFFKKSHNFLRTNQSKEMIGISYLNPHVPRTILFQNNLKFNFFKKIINYVSRILTLNKDYTQSTGTSFRYIILSHFVSYDHLNYNNDFYFGNLAKKLGHKDVLFVLIDHIGFDKKKLKKKIKGNYIVLSKSSDFLDELKMLFLTFFKIFYYHLLNSELKIFNLNNVMNSIDNQRISLKVQKILKNIRCDNFLFTFEGNPYEKLICKELRSIDSNINRVGYQFSVLRKLQHSIYQNINKNYEPDLVFTIGRHNKKLLKSKFKKRLNIYNTGFFKFKKIKKFKKKDIKRSNKKLRILVMPEGIPSEIELFIKYCFNNFDKKIIYNFRMHPIFKKSNFTRQLAENINSNIRISNNDLEYDFRNNDFILYRGTAAVLDALKHNLVPLYLSKKNEISVDPFFNLNKYHIVKFKDNLSNSIINFLSNKKFLKERKKLESFSRFFYERPKYNKIINLMN